MPRIGFPSTLYQEQTSENTEETQENLFMNCLTPEQLEYDYFTRLGAARGMAISVAKNKNPDFWDIDQEERNRIVEPAKDIAEQYEDDEITEKEYLANLIEIYGCEPVQEHISEAQELVEKNEHPIQKKEKKEDEMRKMGFLPEKDDDTSEQKSMDEDSMDKLKKDLVNELKEVIQGG